MIGIIKYILFLMLLTPLSLMGQSSLEKYQNEAIKTKSFDRGSWEKIVGGVDYSEIQKKKKKAKSKKRKKSSSSSSSPSSSSEPFFNIDSKTWRVIGIFVLVLLAIILLVVVLNHLFGNSLFSGPKNTRILTKDGKIDIERIEENMHEIELSDPIQIAIQQGEYDTAIRLYYISILKELSLKKFIKWKKDKTNRDYYNELSGNTIQSPFSRMTNIYERIWYGKKSLQLADFKNLEGNFQQVIDTIKQSVHPSTATNG